jgi:hypothetical protein
MGAGGAIFMQRGTFSLFNSTLSGNQARGGAANSGGTAGQGRGGAVFLLNGGGLIFNSTLAGNIADGSGTGGAGGALYIVAIGGGTPTANVGIANSILADSQNGAAGTTDDLTINQVDGTANVDVTNKNIIESNVNNIGGKASVPGAGAVMAVDPQLGALQNNGGPTLTHKPQAGSPAIGGGDSAACAGAAVGGVDQRRAPRPTVCSIGALDTDTLRSNGTACTADAQCSSQHCIDGFCCNTACGCGDITDCQSCSGSETGGGNGVCAPIAPGRLCRPSKRAADGTSCDAPELCDGSNIACPQDGPKAAGTPCRPAAAGCDAVETCDGTSSACPTDGFLAAGTTCRAVAGPCDVAEVCAGGTPACPANGVKPMGTMCKAQGANATCDPADFCDGVRSSCPASFAAYGSTGAACAAPKSCNGTGRCL